MEDCVFCKIGKKEITPEIHFEDENVIAFSDLHPVKPVHVLIVPKRHIKEFVTVDDMMLYSQMGHAVQMLIRKFELGDKGYKIVVNGGGAQEIDHLHIHLMGPMGRAAAI